MKLRNCALPIFVLLILLLIFPVREQLKIRKEQEEDSTWNVQAEIDAAEWAESPAGKRRLAEQKREKQLYEQATKNVLERRGLTSLSNETTPPDTQLMNEITQEWMDLKHKERK
jgi:hypothetical protein